jgi:hypothetical protein
MLLECSSNHIDEKLADGSKGDFPQTDTFGLQGLLSRRERRFSIREILSCICRDVRRHPLFILTGMLAVCLVLLPVCFARSDGRQSETGEVGDLSERETTQENQVALSFRPEIQGQFEKGSPEGAYPVSVMMFRRVYPILSSADAEASQAAMSIDGSAIYPLEIDAQPEEVSWSRSVPPAQSAAVALRFDEDAPARAKKAAVAKNATPAKAVRDLLSSVETALKSENLDSLLDHLDQTDYRFVIRQKAKAKMLFRQFDKISGTYSDVRVDVLDDARLEVRLHCKVQAAYSKDGSIKTLFDGDQKLILRKTDATTWKICSID